MLNRNHRRAGFSLVELMVATAAMGLVLVYTLGTFTANRNTYVVIDNVSEAHQNILSIASLMERDIRDAGYMVPDAVAACGVDSTTAPDMFFVSDASAIRAANDLPLHLAGEELRAELSGGMPSSSDWTGTPASVSVALEDLVIDEDPTYDANPATAGPDSDFREDGGVIFADLDNPDHTFCGIVTDVDTGSNEITIEFDSSAGEPDGGTSWAFVPAHAYSIDSSNLALVRNGVEMARNVEDLQLAWFYDRDGDGQVDVGEDFASGRTNEEDLDTDGWDEIDDTRLLREIRFNLVVRTAESDPKGVVAGAGQPRENQSNSPGGDGFRRRVHTATIRLRNLAT